MRNYLIQATSFGADASSTFSIYYDTVTSPTQVLVASNVSQASLLAGYTITISDDAYGVYISNESGDCNCFETYIGVPGVPTNTPTPTPTTTPTPTPTPTPTSTATSTPTPTPTPTAAPPTNTPTPTPTPTSTPTPTPTAEIPTPTPTPTPTSTTTPTPTPTPTDTPTPTPTPTPPSAYECPSQGGACYATLEECNASGCPDCAASSCIP
jgi:hypothetical protein